GSWYRTTWSDPAEPPGPPRDPRPAPWRNNRPGQSGRPESGTVRDGPDRHRRVQHGVVKGEVVGRDEVDPRSGQGLPVAAPRLGRSRRKSICVDTAGPVVLQRPLELPGPTDARHAQNRGPHPGLFAEA